MYNFAQRVNYFKINYVMKLINYFLNELLRISVLIFNIGICYNHVLLLILAANPFLTHFTNDFHKLISNYVQQDKVKI